MFIKLALGLAIGSAAISASAQTSDIKANAPYSAYLQDSNGTVARSAYGLCWRTGHWLPADAVLGCDGELSPPIAKPSAPALAIPYASVVNSAAPIESDRCNFTVTLENDQTFQFNSAALSKAAKELVDRDVLPRLAHCAGIEAIRITGHTDLLGAVKYNHRLSEKRAAELVDYLKSKNINSAITATGAGATEPVKTCDKKLPRENLIQCLAPNRRVTIQVKGKSIK
mgnify:CR=1 FL=1